MSLVGWRLGFPRDLEQSSVRSFLAGLHGLVSASTPFRRAAVVFEVERVEGCFEHRLLCSDRHQAWVQAELLAALPGVGIYAWEPDREKSTWRAGLEFGVRNHQGMVRTDDPIGLSAGVLAAMRNVSAKERLLMQWVVAPSPSPALRPRGGFLTPAPELDSEDQRQRRAKHAAPLVSAVGRLAVATTSGPRTKALLGQTLAAIRSADAPGVRIGRRRTSSKHAATRVESRQVPRFEWPMTLNVDELVGLIGWPIGGPVLAGLALGGSRSLPLPASRARKHGVGVGASTFVGEENQELLLSVRQRQEHVLMIGPTGVGKSNLLTSMISQDIAQDRGALVIDPKGDLVNDVLSRVPATRWSDVVLIDPTDTSGVVGLNPLAQAAATSDARRAVIVDQLVGTLHNLFRDSWGIRSQDLLRSTLSTLAATTAPGGLAWTLVDVPGVLTDKNLRSPLTTGLRDPELVRFWSWFDDLSSSHSAEVVSPVLNKLRQILLRPQARRVLGQSDGLDLFQLIQQRKIVLVPLPKGLLGAETSSLLGSLIIAQLWQAVQARARIPADRRSVFMAFIDEAKDFLHLPIDLSDLLAEARGLGLGLHLATQHLDQFPKGLRRAVLANARTKIIFNVEHDDAARLARSVEPALSIDDLKGLGRFEAVVASRAWNPAYVATIRTKAVEGGHGKVEAIREASRNAWATSTTEIDAQIKVRQTAHRSKEQARPIRRHPKDGRAA